MISLLYYLMFRLLSWREKNFTAVVPLFCEDDSVFSQIEDIRMFAELCSVHKKTKIAVINYGASERFLKKIEERYSGYDFLYIVDSVSAGEQLRDVFGGIGD